MSYDFIDTNEQQTKTANLPSEAMRFNGEFIENLIDGYRTLTVTGREMLSTNINILKLNQSPGRWNFGTTVDERYITIKYKLRADTPSELMLKWRKLNEVLNNSPLGYPVENAEISFNDEEGVFYYGMKGDVATIPEGKLEVISSFTLFFGDPFKYGLSTAYDLKKPLEYDKGAEYGSLGYRNTQGFAWNIVPHHYSAVENYSTLDTAIKIIIKGTVKDGSITHLPTNQTLKLPNITNGVIVVDTETFNLSVNGVDVLEFEGDFFDLVEGNNGLLFKAEQANAIVNYDWLHKYM